MSFWPFNRKNKVVMLDPSELNFTQVDFSDQFDHHLLLSKDQWVKTIPMNQHIGHDNKGNLPASGASDHEVYRVALHLSEIREHFRVPGDGVYCPVCHIANVDFEKLGTPCSNCDRPLLAFGWS